MKQLLQRGDIILKEVFELPVGEHLVDELEDGLLIVLVELLNEPDLLCGGLVFSGHFLGHATAVIVEDASVAMPNKVAIFCRSSIERLH